jgi:hypothetical protein
VELGLTCAGLADMDTFSKSDPFAVLYMRDSKSGNWLYLDRTETIDNTLDPQWAKKFVLDFHFEKRQLLKVEVYDADSASPRLADHDYIGSCEVSLGEVVRAQGRGDTRPLLGAKQGQTITLVAEELLASREVVRLQLEGRKLDRKDWWGLGTSDPFLTVLRAGEFGAWRVLHRTEVRRGQLDPTWLPIELTVSSLCNADHHRPLRLRVEDWNLSGSHSLIGELETSLHSLLQLQPGAELALVHPKKKSKKKSYKDSGKLVMRGCHLETRPTFMDFVQGGMELSFTVAIDFTASNGNPSSPDSLHYNDPTGRPNQYLTAIRAVGDIIQDYDTDKLFPALGFGARLPPDGRVSHEFFLNLSPSSPYCEGIDGVMAAYHHALNSVQLYGPTNFAPVVNHVARMARPYRTNPTNFQVLLIITDGIICDMEATKAAIIAASSLPMSIIIVGVGNEDFQAMDDLDSDDKLLEQGGLTAQRDIVQFVELNRFVSVGGRGWDQELLAREVLAEVPDQIVGFMRAGGHRPGAKGAPPPYS